MSHYFRSYKDLSPEDADTQAIADIKEYCSEKQWEALLFEAGRASQEGTAAACKSMNFACGFCGISGYPFHAFARKYFLGAYRAWLAEPDKANPEGIKTDERGFSL